MSVLKLTKKDITRNDGKEEKIKLKKSDLFLDSAKLSSWETTNKQSLDILNGYNERINNSEWLSDEDRESYRNALDSYVKTSNYLRGINKTFGEGYTEEDEKKWLDSVASMTKGYDDISNYYSQFTSDKEYNKWYENYKKSEEFKSVLGAEDFEHYSQMGANIENPNIEAVPAPLNIFGWKPFGEGAKVGNVVTMSRDNADYIGMMEANGGNTSDYGLRFLYKFMEDDEVSVYNYYLGKGDTAKASEYLASLEDTLQQRHAGKMVEKVDNTALELVFSAGAGLEQFASGVRNLDNFIMGTEGDQTSAIQYAQAQMSSNNKGIWKVSNDLINTTGNMLPSILVGSFTGGLGGALTLGTSAVGNGYAEMRNLGYDEWQSRGYGALVGASETVLQYALGGISKLGGKVTGKAIGNLVSKIDNVFAKTAIKLGGNMASEGLEEAIQTTLEPAFKALVTGEEFESAAWEEILYSALLGALSAGVLEGAPTIANTAYSSIQAKKAYGDGSAIVNEALGVATEGSDLEALANKYKGKIDGGKSLSGSQIIYLNEAIASNDVAKIKSATEARLTELGETGDVSRIAEVLTKQATGEKLTLSEKSILKNSQFGQRVSNELNAENIQSGEYSSAWAENIGTRRVSPETYNKQLYDLASQMPAMREVAEIDSVAKTVAEAQNATGTKFEASESDKTIYKSADGKTEDVTVNKIVSTKGGIKVELDNGQTVSAKDLSFSTQEEALMYEMVTRMEASPETANEIINTFKPTNVKQASMYFASVPLAYQYGKIGYEAGLKNINLPQNQKQLAYNRGRMDAMANTESQTKASPKKANSSKKTTAPKSGIIYENGFTYDETSANEMQKKSMIGIEVIDKMSNLEVHVFESKVVNGKRVAHVNGKLVKAPNGYFKDGNKIYIDINAGNGGEGAMLYTMSHEVTHYIRKWNEKGFKELGDFLIEQYGKKGVPVNALLEAQKKKIKERYKEEKKALPSEAKLADMAYEELVADAMSDMFTDPKSYEKLAKLKEKDLKLWQKLGEAIKALLDKLKTALGIYKEQDVAVAKEAFEVRGFSADVYNKLQDLYIKAFVEADENYEASGGEGTVSSSEDVKHSERDDKIDTDSTEYKIRTSMTMAEAKRMIETAYKVNNIAEYYEGEYKDAEDWLKKAGSDEVEMYIENDFDLQAKYINSNDDILNEKYRISDVLDAYLAGTLIGKEKPNPKRLDVSQSTKLEDSRFYSPQKIEDAKATFELAKQKAVGKDVEAINRARAEILLFAHNKGAAELLGVTQSELNKKLRGWSNYSATAKNISERINAGVAEENRWTGIENSSYINKAKVTNEDIERLVASVEGDSKGYERKYIARVMLAADTHIDYSGLKFKFASSQQVNADHNSGGNSGGRVLGFYDDTNRQIEVTHDKPNTVAHEMGHYIDAQWGRELVGSSSSHLFLTRGVNADIVRERYGEPGVQFLNNFKLFINSLSDVNQTYNSYYNNRGEIFARFFARFIEWTDNIATGNKYYSYESTMYGDKFTQAQYLEFAKLLQEKALLDGNAASSKTNTNNIVSSAKQEIMHSIKYTKDGAIVWIEDDVLRGNKLPSHQAVADYLVQHIGEVYTIIESGQKVYLGKDLPSEYTQSKYTKALLRKPSLLKAKNKALPNLGEMIEIATNRRWSKDKGSGKKDAKYGVYKYDTRFAFPVFDNKGNKVRAKAYDATLVIINSSDGKKYLYDLVTIKENTSVSVELSQRESIPAQEQVQKESVSDSIVAQDTEFVNSEFSDDEMFSYRDDLKEAKSTLKTKYKVDPRGVESLAERYYNSYGGSMTKTEFTLHFVSIANKLAETFANSTYGNDATLNSALEEITNLADEISNEPKDDGVMATELREIKKHIRRIRIEIPKYNKGDFDVAGGFENFRKKHFGKLNLTNDGTNVDALYPELQGLFGEAWFPSDIETLPDQLLRIAEVVDTPLSSVSEVGYDVDEAKEYTQSALYEELSEIIENSQKPQSELHHIDYRDSENAVSNRTLLANALDSIAKNDIEKNKLKQYKDKIALIESEQAKLAETRAKAQELRFTKGRTPAETKQMRDLDFEANQIANRISTYDKQLLNLESTAALKGVLEREKTMLRKKLAQKEKESIKAVKERAANTQRELLTRYQESRAKAIEGRNKTEMRHKIKKVVSDLNKLLLNPTKEQHVPIGLQLVVAEALDAINMDTMNAEERVAYYNDLIAKSSDPDEIEMLTKKRDFFEYRDANFKERITALKNAYAEFKRSEDPLIKNAHNESIEDLIENTANAVGSKSLKDMSIAQLEAVYDMYKAVLATVRNSNKMFKEGRQATVTENSESVKVQVKEVGGHRERVLKLAKFFKKFGWNMLKPVTAMKVIGSKTFAELFDNVRAAEDTWAVDVNEAKEFYKGVSDKYGYNKWDFKTQYNFKDSRGEAFSISLDQMLSLYAYSKREQADEHLEFGGFIFDDVIEVTKKNKLGIPLKYEVNDANPHRLGTIQIMEIIGKLTKEQRAFVDEMQTYLSDVMGEKGNEVSLALYDIKLYKEKNYFPLKTARYFREFDPEKSGTPKIKNSGFSKKTVPQAGNPIVLSNFMDVWAGHVNDMSMYHAFVLPLEDFMRVYNYSSTAGGYDSVQQYIKNAYGSQANQYIEKLMDDLNGGARVDSSADFMNKLISLHKKASVFASASVVIQQPSAIARAFAYINPKYFVTSSGSTLNIAKHKSVWAEVKKYAPVAVIKEMGYFDTGMGRSTVEWLKGNQTIKDKVDDALSKAPAMADELSWSYIWLAVKNEVKSTTNLKVGSEEFLKKCGQRFTEIITNTQVYDSVLSRSQYMRSKDTGVKMAMAFMAEPTTTVNMMVDGIIQGKRGNKKFTAATVGAVSSSIILNSMLVALVYAARDDDEDETYTEKYIGSLTSELLDGFNPLTYLPWIKDLWSIGQGYDVERSDMSVVSDLWKTVEGLFNEDKSGWAKVSDVSGAVASLFGLPVKNILRDAKGMYNLIETVLSDTPTTKAGIADSVEDAVKNSIPLWDRLHESDTKSDKLYEAIISGDQTHIERVKGRFDDESEIDAAIRKALRENDSRIQEATMAVLTGNGGKRVTIQKEIIAEGHFKQDYVVKATNAEIEYVRTKIKEAKEYSKQGKTSEADKIYNTLLGKGYTKEFLDKMMK